MDKHEILTNVRDWVADPFGHMRRIREARGLRVVGYFPADFPEELYLAAGLTPFAVFGTGAPPRLADGYLQSFADPLARGFLEVGLSGHLDFLEGLVVTHIDDTTRVLASIVRRNLPLPWFNDFLPPKRTDTPAALPYLADELRRHRRDLEISIGQKISDHDLEQAIHLCNRDRELLRAISHLRRKRPESLSVEDFYSVVRASLTMPKELHIHLLETLLSTLQDEAKPESVRSRGEVTRLLPSGYGCEHPALFSLFDELESFVPADDLMLGMRLFHQDERGSTVDPVLRIAERFLSLPPTPFYVGRPHRRDYLVELVHRERIEGVVFLQLKFSETLNYDYPNLRDALKQEGIPALLLETDLGNAGMGPLRTRLEAFLEMIRGAIHD